MSGPGDDVAGQRHSLWSDNHIMVEMRDKDSISDIFGCSSFGQARLPFIFCLKTFSKLHLYISQTFSNKLPDKNGKFLNNEGKYKENFLVKSSRLVLVRE